MITALLFSLDLSALGYLVNNRIGALCYNLFHTFISVFILPLFGIILYYDLLNTLGLIFAAHIGIDRPIGYGLKYPNEIRENHFKIIILHLINFFTSIWVKIFLTLFKFTVVFGSFFELCGDSCSEKHDLQATT